MVTKKLKLDINPSGYSVKSGDEVIFTKLDGGAGRYRRDIIGATSSVNVSWTLNELEYLYFNSFYNAVTANGSSPFKIDLIIDKPYLTEHSVYFVPGSKQLTSQKGLTYEVSATLEVIVDKNEQLDLDIVFAYELLGEDFARVESEFDSVVNKLS